MSEIHLHIEELVLRGFDPADRHTIADAVQRELLQLVTDRGLLQHDLATPSVDGGKVTFQPGTSSSDMGSAIAHNIHGAIGNGH
jgi:hypothetical protein